MNKGVVIFAHNNRTLDYGRMAILSGILAKKNLDVPVSLITDPFTVDWMKEDGIFEDASKIFDKIIISVQPDTKNVRKIHDGALGDGAHCQFLNSNRSNAWDLTPYERTLLIDSDYFILSDNLNNYWNVDCDLMISKKYNDIIGEERTGYLDKRISDTGIEMLWATTVMFTKNEYTQTFFNLVDHIRENYERYGDIYRYDYRVYRNDIAFSIANHIMNGFQESDDYSLPPVLSTIDKDMLHDYDKNKLTFLITDLKNNYAAATIQNKDVHVMNKLSIVRNYKKILKMEAQ